jgi:hypothetical protein
VFLTLYQSFKLCIILDTGNVVHEHATMVCRLVERDIKCDQRQQEQAGKRDRIITMVAQVDDRGTGSVYFTEMRVGMYEPGKNVHQNKREKEVNVRDKRKEGNLCDDVRG